MAHPSLVTLSSPRDEPPFTFGLEDIQALTSLEIQLECVAAVVDMCGNGGEGARERSLREVCWNRARLWRRPGRVHSCIVSLSSDLMTGKRESSLCI